MLRDTMKLAWTLTLVLMGCSRMVLSYFLPLEPNALAQVSGQSRDWNTAKALLHMCVH